MKIHTRGIESSEVHITHLFPRLCLVEEPCCVGPSTKERMTRFQRFRDLEIFEEILHLGFYGKLTLNVTRPDLYDAVSVVL